MIVFFIVVFFIVYLAFGMELGFGDGSAWYTHFTYSFQHGSFLHLILNCISWLAVANALERFIRPWVFLLVAYVVAVAVSWVVSYSVPVVGASGMIYAMLGMYMSLIIRGRVCFGSTFNLWLFFISIFTFLTISFLKTNSAGLLHLLCLCGGFGFVHLKKNI